ncbi:hypothetical protein QYE76_005411 [Lolium multiflorum]|uniref:Uncharacterized protein n=1 Tax=Lolium multiflorum TaxID=4521 RepID=A0AAD8W3D5_LOLMU|nr:hypothetical protein QYE76_005411 [Lolium multiflorum]
MDKENANPIVHGAVGSKRDASSSTPSPQRTSSPPPPVIGGCRRCRATSAAKTSTMTSRRVLRRLQVGQYVSYFAIDKGVYKCPFCTRRLGGTDFNCSSRMPRTSATPIPRSARR